jgi:hypothetical protein
MYIGSAETTASHLYQDLLVALDPRLRDVVDAHIPPSVPARCPHHVLLNIGQRLD